MVSKETIAFDVGRALGRHGKPLSLRFRYNDVREWLEQGHSIGFWERFYDYGH